MVRRHLQIHDWKPQKNECVHKINDWKDHIEESSWLHGKRVGGHVCALAFPSSKQKQRIHTKNNDDFWPWLADQIKQHGVQVLMGDFNMSLFKVVPELRSRGVPAAVAAWYPWRTKDTQQPMADSCGIFMCVPGCTTECKYSQTIFDDPFWWQLDEHEENGGPGQSLHTYLPKGQDIVEKVTETFTECPPAVAGKGAIEQR